jgi:hypothetical protein
MKNILLIGNTLNQGTPRGNALWVIVNIFQIYFLRVCLDEKHYQGFVG